jgi:hypothetical protein
MLTPNSRSHATRSNPTSGVTPLQTYNLIGLLIQVSDGLYLCESALTAVITEHYLRLKLSFEFYRELTSRPRPQLIPLLDTEFHSVEANSRAGGLRM